jgi:hypothetical protein
MPLFLPSLKCLGKTLKFDLPYYSFLTVSKHYLFAVVRLLEGCNPPPCAASLLRSWRALISIYSHFILFQHNTHRLNIFWIFIVKGIWW